MNNNSNMMIDNNDYPNTMTASAGFSMNSGHCNCCCEKGMAPKVPMYYYEFTNIEEEETCPERESTREEMNQEIRCLSFGVVELAEYLDTHVDDEKALCLHREYATKLRDLKEYQHSENVYLMGQIPLAWQLLKFADLFILMLW